MVLFSGFYQGFYFLFVLLIYYIFSKDRQPHCYFLKNLYNLKNHMMLSLVYTSILHNKPFFPQGTITKYIKALNNSFIYQSVAKMLKSK